MRRAWILVVWLAPALGCSDPTTIDPGADASSGPCTAECDDGLFCNGVETCDPDDPAARANGCVDGTAPCASSACNEAADDCGDCEDADGDGHGAAPCGDDCDDADDAVYPGAAEICDGDDEDCDPETLGSEDGDGDDVVAERCCNGDACGGDCNDARASVHPGATEPCNGLDDDCDGAADEGVLEIFYRDVDGDGFGRSDETTADCTVPLGHVLDDGDCDDRMSAIHPGAEETCDGVDNDCDGTVDMRPPPLDVCRCTIGMVVSCGTSDGAGGFSMLGICVPGTQRCVEGFWGECTGATTATVETCDMRDEDCDGSVDEGTIVRCYPDSDGDGYSGGGAVSDRCPDASRPEVGRCPAGYTDRDPAAARDCDEGRPDVRPMGPELCNTRDDDCDTRVDEMAEIRCYTDGDRDGYAASGATASMLCPDTGGSCPTGFTSRMPAAGTTDCNDGSGGATIHPGASESCNSTDDDCDGTTDEGVGTLQYADADGDTYGEGLPPVSYALDSMYIEAPFTTTTWGTSAPGRGGTGRAASVGYSGWYGALALDADVAPRMRLTFWYRTATDGGGLEVYSGGARLARYEGVNDWTMASFSITPGRIEWRYDRTGGSGVDRVWVDDVMLETEGTRACAIMTGYVTRLGDCDDARALTYSGAQEICDPTRPTDEDADCDGIPWPDETEATQAWCASRPRVVVELGPFCRGPDPFGDSGCSGIRCQSGFGNCDGPRLMPGGSRTMNENGCEASLDTMTNCGSCGNTCTGVTRCMFSAGAYRCL